MLVTGTTGDELKHMCRCYVYQRNIKNQMSMFTISKDNLIFKTIGFQCKIDLVIVYRIIWYVATRCRNWSNGLFLTYSKVLMSLFMMWNKQQISQILECTHSGNITWYGYDKHIPTKMDLNQAYRLGTWLYELSLYTWINGFNSFPC